MSTPLVPGLFNLTERIQVYRSILHLMGPRPVSDWYPGVRCENRWCVGTGETSTEKLGTENVDSLPPLLCKKTFPLNVSTLIRR